tara:strand:- start:393 stop:1139 length:747 start_codon:yes stop_codon:yes gene_type:complete
MDVLAEIGHNNPPSEMEILQGRLDGYTNESESLDRLGKFDVIDEITLDGQAGQITDHIKALKILKKSITEIHTKEKKPFLECGRQADVWKKDYFFKIEALIETASVPVLAWNKKKEALERKRQLEIARKAQEDADALIDEAAAHADAGIDSTANELMEAAQREEETAEMILNNVSSGIVGRSRGGFSSASNSKPWTGMIESKAALDLDALREYLTDEDLNKAIKRAVRNGVRKIRGASIYQEEKLTIR